MAVARLLAELAHELSRVHGFDPFAPDAIDALARSEAVAPVLNALECRGAWTGSKAALLALQALAIDAARVDDLLLSADVVMTLPAHLGWQARTTAGVLDEMLFAARHEVIAIGYEFSDERFMAALASAGSRAEITLICDRRRQNPRRILRKWPGSIPPPTVYQDVVRARAAPYSKMHGKGLVVDGSDLLLSSANFTFHGLHGNIEFGVRLRGRCVRDVRDVLKSLLKSSLLERFDRNE